MKFWAVLGSQAAEKKNPNFHNYSEVSNKSITFFYSFLGFFPTYMALLGTTVQSRFSDTFGLRKNCY